MASPLDLLTSFPRQDFITIGALDSPGICTISGAGLLRSYDIRKGYGFAGGTTVFTGNMPTKFDIEFYLWEPAQFQEWEIFARAIMARDPRGPSPALGVKHPLLNLPPLSISSIVFEEIGQWEQDDYSGWTCKCKCIEWRPPVPMLGKPNAAIPAVTKPTPTAQDAAEIQIQKLTAEFSALAGG